MNQIILEKHLEAYIWAYVCTGAFQRHCLLFRSARYSMHFSYLSTTA